MSGEGTLRASYKVHRCVCVCPATGRGRAAPGGAGREPPGGHAGRRASLKKRHGEGGDTVRRQAGSPSPWGDPELEGCPLWPLSQPSPWCHPCAVLVLTPRDQLMISSSSASALAASVAGSRLTWEHGAASPKLPRNMPKEALGASPKALGGPRQRGPPARSRSPEGSGRQGAGLRPAAEAASKLWL